MKRYKLIPSPSGTQIVKSDDGDLVYYDEAQAEIDSLQCALSLMNKTAEAMHKEINQLKAKLALAKELLEDWRDAVTIPRTNCSCHISAPCNDCYEWGELRETASETKKLLGVPQ